MYKGTFRRSSHSASSSPRNLAQHLWVLKGPEGGSESPIEQAVARSIRDDSILSVNDGNRQPYYCCS
jgi:hypothetical protein